MSSSNAKEKFIVAVHGMASSPKSIQDRIADAFIYSIHLIQPEKIPVEVRSKYEEICKRMTTIQNEESGAFRASAQSFSDDEAVEIAKIIIEIYDELCYAD